jgi:hypothetical protein
LPSSFSTLSCQVRAENSQKLTVLIHVQVMFHVKPDWVLSHATPLSRGGISKEQEELVANESDIHQTGSFFDHGFKAVSTPSVLLLSTVGKKKVMILLLWENFLNTNFQKCSQMFVLICHCRGTCLIRILHSK